MAASSSKKHPGTKAPVTHDLQKPVRLSSDSVIGRCKNMRKKNECQMSATQTQCKKAWRKNENNPVYDHSCIHLTFSLKKRRTLKKETENPTHAIHKVGKCCRSVFIMTKRMILRFKIDQSINRSYRRGETRSARTWHDIFQFQYKSEPNFRAEFQSQISEPNFRAEFHSVSVRFHGNKKTRNEVPTARWIFSLFAQEMKYGQTVYRFAKVMLMGLDGVILKPEKTAKYRVKIEEGYQTETLLIDISPTICWKNFHATSSSINQSINQATNHSINRSIYRPINQSINRVLQEYGKTFRLISLNLTIKISIFRHLKKEWILSVIFWMTKKITRIVFS